MPQAGDSSVAPYPIGPGGYGDHSQAPPPGFNMGYNHGPPPVMYQPGPVSGPEHGGIIPAPVGMPAAVPVGVPPGLEYLTQVRTSPGLLDSLLFQGATPVFRGLKSKSGGHLAVDHQLTASHSHSVMSNGFCNMILK